GGRRRWDDVAGGVAGNSPARDPPPGRGVGGAPPTRLFALPRPVIVLEQERVEVGTPRQHLVVNRHRADNAAEPARRCPPDTEQPDDVATIGVKAQRAARAGLVTGRPRRTGGGGIHLAHRTLDPQLAADLPDHLALPFLVPP